jgi:acyl-[acyl-carrier-protein] desaturase
MIDPRISPTTMRDLVGGAVGRAVERQWSIEDLDWSTLDPDRLTDADRSVVRFITFIEDHIPGYLTYFLDAFPLAGTDKDGQDLAIEEFCFNREYFRFLISWAYDEERHASVLTRYQVESRMTEPDALQLELAEEGRKRFLLPYESPIQAFTYTLVQEKATQLFYQRFREVVTEPVLRDLLNRLARDEARHFAFYYHLVGEYLRRDGAKAVPNLKDVIATFRMPLADTLKGYWRWSLKVADTAGYGHTEAYESVVRLVQGFVTTRGEAEVEDLADFVAAIRKIG